MAFGSGVLISALSFELMEEAFEEAGTGAAAVGFLVGAGLYAGANALLARRGAQQRKRSGDHQPSEEEASGSGAAIAVGALLDGIPESIAIGLSILHGGAVSVATVVAIFLSNLPEGLSSSDGMKRSGRSAGYVFGVWTSIAVACGVSPFVVAATTALAAGAMLTMIVDTMIPESVEGTGSRAGIYAVLGFLFSFALSHLEG
jgi:ZIP family zinc transporter